MISQLSTEPPGRGPGQTDIWHRSAMVVVQVKQSDTDVFVVESSISESNDALVRRLVSQIFTPSGTQSPTLYSNLVDVTRTQTLLLVRSI